MDVHLFSQSFAMAVLICMASAIPAPAPQSKQQQRAIEPVAAAAGDQADPLEAGGDDLKASSSYGYGYYGGHGYGGYGRYGGYGYGYPSYYTSYPHYYSSENFGFSSCLCVFIFIYYSYQAIHTTEADLVVSMADITEKRIN